MEFHISRSSREKYKFDKRLFASTGNVVFANFQAARQFAKQMNDIRKIQSQKPAYVSPGELNALGMIDEIFHIVVYEYYKENGKRLQSDLYQELADKVGKERLESTLLKFTNLYPPVEVFQQQCSELDYLNGQTNGVPNQEVVLEEMLMTWLTNVNTAADPFEELFSDSDLKKTTAYSSIIDGIKVFFRKQSSFGPEDQDLVSMLRTPAIVEPKSLSGQLSYIREHWGYLLGDRLLRLLGSLDMLMEEQKASFLGPGPTLVPDYSKDALDGLLQLERFSPDSDWMPRVVMIAKNSYVWLNQLSRQFQRQIDRLDQIPDETLDELVRWGFTGLWLIGLWERSEASKTIKQLCGNPMLSHQRTRSGITRLLPGWEEKNLIIISANAVVKEGSAWLLTWFPTIWVSIPIGFMIIRSGLFHKIILPSRITASMDLNSRATLILVLISKTITIPVKTRRLFLNYTIIPMVKPAISTMETTVQVCPGTILPN